jgi:YggT family protein
MSLICWLLNAFLIVIFVRIVLSWFPPTGGLIDQVQRIVFTATEWIMGPLRRVLPPVRLGAAALDLSPMVVILGVILLQGAIC